MRKTQLTVPLYLPNWLHANLHRVKHALFPPPQLPSINLAGDRQVEWSFVSAEIPEGPGKALDFGCGDGYLSLLAARKGFQVLAVDLERQNFWWHHTGVEFLQGDLLGLNLPQSSFDLIINCSAVEHVGIAGRYGVTKGQNDGDLEVMRRFAALLKPRGVLLMTVPCGRDAVMAPWHRVYGEQRLPRLLSGFHVEKEAYWNKDSENRWVVCSREVALDFEPRSDPKNPLISAYALACFVLRKGHSPSHSADGGQ